MANYITTSATTIIINTYKQNLPKREKMNIGDGGWCYKEP